MNPFGTGNGEYYIEQIILLQSQINQASLNLINEIFENIF